MQNMHSPLCCGAADHHGTGTGPGRDDDYRWLRPAGNSESATAGAAVQTASPPLMMMIIIATSRYALPTNGRRISARRRGPGAARTN